MQEADINLEVFNLETDFFGDLHCSSRFTDMLCDAQAQYGDYSELDMCPMWGMWGKKGENEILDDIDFDRYGKVKCSKIEGMLPKLMKMVEGEKVAIVSQHTRTISPAVKRRERWLT